MDWDRVNGDQRTGKPWLHQLDEPDLAALGAATGVPPETLAGMTLARYQGTGLAEVTAPPGMRRTPRWWRQLSGSRYCPRCLAANGGRWMLAWRIPWAFACTGCQVLLADTCPDCGRRHLRTRTGQPRQPGRCDLTGLPLPPWRPPRGGTAACTSDPAGTPAAALPAGGHVLAAQQHVDAVIAALLASRGQPAETAALQQYLDDACAVARAAVSAVNGTASLPAAAIAVLDELGARPGPGAAASALASPLGRAAPAARARHRVRRHHRRHHAARPARRPRPRHRRAGSPATPPAAATPPARRTSSPTGTRPAPPCKPPWPGRWRPSWTPSTSSATAPSPARPASPTPPAPGNAPQPCRR